MARVLDLTPISADAFAPFGTLIEAKDGVQFMINEGTTTRFHRRALADVGANGTAALSIFRGTRRAVPIEIKMMERHPLGSQAFLPLSDARWIVIVSGADVPHPDNLVGFWLNGDQGVQYGANVWHHPLLISVETQDFVVMDRDGPGDNLDEYFFADGVRARVEL